MTKVIVTTTINPPTEALRKFNEIKGWTLLIVGDKKTPHIEYKDFGIYLSPEYQDILYPKLSLSLGWNTIQRRNIGFLYAYNVLNADIVATVDDDNIPNDIWPNCIIDQETDVSLYSGESKFFDPLFNTNIWHRGFPIDQLENRSYTVESIEKIKVKIQAGLWYGDPDIDAIARIAHRPNIVKNIYPKQPYGSKLLTPFNSQNTFLHKDILPHYMCIPGVGRMDDIYGAYIAQKLTNEIPVFTEPSVTQVRNQHNLVVDLEKELMGYKIGSSIDDWENLLPAYSLTTFNLYRSKFK